MREHPDAIKAITMTVSQMDTDEAAPESAPAPVAKAAPKAEAKPEPKAAPVVEAKPEVVEEPKKVVKKSAAPEPTEKSDLADIVGEWDD